MDGITALFEQQFLFIVADFVDTVIIMFHLLHFRQLPVIETSMPDAGKQHSLAPFFSPLEHHFLIKAKQICHANGVLVIELQIIGKLLPNVLVFRKTLEKRNRAELPPEAGTPAFAVGYPAAGYHPAPR